MARILALLTALGLMTLGALFTWPAVRVLTSHERVAGEILDVYAHPLDEGRALISVLYRFPLPPGADQARRWQMAWNQANQQWRIMPDPVIPAERAEAVIQDLLAGDRRRTVWFQANDPEGTAFILDEATGRPGRRVQTGLALFAVGLLWWLLARRRSH
jgi:hypothetical protein